MASRNELCPCGSGKKSKKCCGGTEERRTRGLVLLIAPLALIGAVGIYAGLKGPDEASPTVRSSVVPAPGPAPAATSTATGADPAEAVPQALQALPPGSPQPGPAPAGKVWSTEHGHWHDVTPQSESPIQIEMAGGAPASAVQSSGSDVRIDANAIPGLPIGQPVPQPSGQAPEGKVWSAEHGHWHDAAAPQLPVRLGTVNQPSEPVAQPPGPTPAGQVWSAEHGHFHNAPAGPRAEQPAPAPAPQPVAQPSPQAPAGKVWSREHGHWHNAPPNQVD